VSGEEISVSNPFRAWFSLCFSRFKPWRTPLGASLGRDEGIARGGELVNGEENSAFETGRSNTRENYGLSPGAPPSARYVGRERGPSAGEGGEHLQERKRLGIHRHVHVPGVSHVRRPVGQRRGARGRLRVEAQHRHHRQATCNPFTPPSKVFFSLRTSWSHSACCARSRTTGRRLLTLNSRNRGSSTTRSSTVDGAGRGRATSVWRWHGRWPQ
jgi:hypothetical protein